MSNLSVIIPIHKYDNEVENLLPVAVNSVVLMDTDCEIVFVGPAEVMKQVKVLPFKVPFPVSYVENENSDFCNQVNLAVSKVTSPYFTVLEFDDQFTPIWMKNVERYIESKNNVPAVYLPLIENNDFKKTDFNFAGYSNEVSWARGFSEGELGYITHDTLLAYYNYCLSGAVIKTDVFMKYGGLKPSIKLFFWYEFLLRITKNGESIFTIPKLGYKHTVNRDGSMINVYEETLPTEEAEWWLKTAQDECFYNYDRGTTYEA